VRKTKKGQAKKVRAALMRTPAMIQNKTAIRIRVAMDLYSVQASMSGEMRAVTTVLEDTTEVKRTAKDAVIARVPKAAKNSQPPQKSRL